MDDQGRTPASTHRSIYSSQNVLLKIPRKCLPYRLNLIKFRFTLIAISLSTYSLVVQLPLLKEQQVKKGRNTLQP